MYVCIVTGLNSALQEWVSRWCRSSKTRSWFESMWMHRVTCPSSVEFPSGTSEKKFPYLITTRDVTVSVIVHTRLFACNMTSLSAELIYLNPCIFLMCFELPRPSVSLLHLVAFYYAKLTVLIAKTKYRVCCIAFCCSLPYSAVVNMFREFYQII
jgi:hypothetical protein